MSTWTQQDQAWYERMQRQLEKGQEQKALTAQATEHHMRAWEVARAAGWHPNEEMLNNEPGQMPSPLDGTPEKQEAWKIFHAEMRTYHELQFQAWGNTYNAESIAYHTKMLSWPWEA